MKELFLLSGLGADKRVFDFLDLSDYSIHHVNWIIPIPKESMAQYANRLLPQITSDKPILHWRFIRRNDRVGNRQTYFR